MHRFLFAFLFFMALGAGMASAQSAPTRVAPDPRLFAAFDSAYIAMLQRDHPILLERWNFYLDHAFMITDYPSGKGLEQLQALPVVHIDERQPVNILVLEKTQHLHHDWDKPVVYRINDSNRVLMYQAGKDFNRALRQWREKRS